MFEALGSQPAGTSPVPGQRTLSNGIKIRLGNPRNQGHSSAGDWKSSTRTGHTQVSLVCNNIMSLVNPLGASTLSLSSSSPQDHWYP